MLSVEETGRYGMSPVLHKVVETPGETKSVSSWVKCLFFERSRGSQELGNYTVGKGFGERYGKDPEDFLEVVLARWGGEVFEKQGRRRIKLGAC